MKKTNTLWILILLVMFPQFVETIYSPALPLIARKFGVSEETATLTISFYFIAFAAGVIFWGIQCDRIGRKKSMLSGLFTYSTGAIIALVARNFEILLLARIISAFGIAVGSVVTQTILRDLYDKEKIGKAFSFVGIGLSISPVIGMLTGAVMSSHLGYMGVFGLLFILAIILIFLAQRNLKETVVPNKHINIKSSLHLLKKMLNDRYIWRDSILVMSFNVMLFSYYSLAPFIFKKEGFSTTDFGYSGFILAIGTLIGALTNKRLIKKGFKSEILIRIGGITAFIAALIVEASGEKIWFLIPFCFIVMAYGIAIPNILSTALFRYKSETGSAGAVFGLIYYILIGLGLVITGAIQHLGLSLSIFSGIALGAILLLKKNTATL
ncbi:multidrug effflux MFS transporter [Elizabethkingia anophelis]|nr:multidrug effflux MFS transporter [Elizabethkingia anophelis]MCT3694982.1 multidrug effflux MFS transporter [Elizabethkingia anophelis]MCT3858852.1 multidrug effflux MFS transporter [Elizabethkingia anophelis]MCT3912025.1 multidrug effflux MFS transporter [Elizabethkingia anophelis]MCT4311276.1 multidrug effflux MFS transporter [Elizabethkingia anophelis]